MKLFLFNGWGSTADCWSRILPALRSNGLCCLPLDWTTHLQHPEDGVRRLHASESSAPSKDNTDDIWLAGWSLGGMLALQAASALLAQGLPVRGLLLISTTARMTADAQFPGVEARLLKAMKLRLRREAAAQMTDFASLCFQNYPNHEEDCDKFAATAGSLPTPILDAGLNYLQNTDLRPLLPTLAHLPAIVLHGEADAVIPHAAGEILAHTLPHAHFRPLKKSPHALPYTHSDVIIHAVRELTER